MNSYQNIKVLFCCYALVLMGTGCAAVSSHQEKSSAQRLLNTSKEESLRDVSSALTAVTGSVSNKELSEKELYQAAKELHNDPEAQSAVKAVSSAFDRKDVQIKYSPVTGKRYSADMDIDPETGAKLLILK